MFKFLKEKILGWAKKISEKEEEKAEVVEVEKPAKKQIKKEVKSKKQEVPSSFVSTQSAERKKKAEDTSRGRYTRRFGNVQAAGCTGRKRKSRLSYPYGRLYQLRN